MTSITHNSHYLQLDHISYHGTFLKKILYAVISDEHSFPIMAVAQDESQSILAYFL